MDAIKQAIEALERGLARCPKDGERFDLSGYINGADILASDMPHTVVEKLQAAIDAARGADRG
jgi:hypothetical protein